MASTRGATKVIGVVEECTLTDQEAKEIYAKNKDGIVSCEFVKAEDLPEDVLEMLFEQSPEWVTEHRPDWVKKHKATAIH